jgi:hypothetical protein
LQGSPTLLKFFCEYPLRWAIQEENILPFFTYKDWFDPTADLMKRLAFTLCAIFVFTTAYLQHSIPMAQTFFIQDFLKLVEWPDDCKQGSFVIGVLGSTDLYQELRTQLEGKKSGDQIVNIRRYESPDAINECHVLFVPFSETRYMAAVRNRLSDRNTLIITEKNGALNEGAAINFVIFQQKMKFEVSAANAGKYGLQLSPQLKEMAMHAL